MSANANPSFGPTFGSNERSRVVDIYKGYLRAQGGSGELRDDGGEQTTGVGDQVWREQLHLFSQTLPHRQHHDHQHLLQNLPETGHAHQVLLSLWLYEISTRIWYGKNQSDDKRSDNK